MVHFCIFQIFSNGSYKYLEDFNSSEFLSDRFSQEASHFYRDSYNKSRSSSEQKEFYFIVRRLDESEFVNISSYNPISYRFYYEKNSSK